MSWPDVDESKEKPEGYLSPEEEYAIIADELEADYFATGFSRFVDYLAEKGIYPESTKMSRDQAFEYFCEHKGIKRTGFY